MFDSPGDTTARIADAFSTNQFVKEASLGIYHVDIAINDSGALGVAFSGYTTYSAAGSSDSVSYQSLSPAGAKNGSLQKLSGNFASTSIQFLELDMNNSGQAIAAWNQPGNTSNYVYDVYARRIGSTGAAFQVHDDTDESQTVPEVQISDTGSSVVLWNGNTQQAIPAGSTNFMRHYDAAGQGGAQIDLGGTGERALYHAADMAPDGTFAVSVVRVANFDNTDPDGTTTRTTPTSLEVLRFDAAGVQVSQRMIAESVSTSNVTTGAYSSTNGRFTRLDLNYTSAGEYLLTYQHDLTPDGTVGDEVLLGEYLLA